MDVGVPNEGLKKPFALEKHRKNVLTFKIL
jgi:hypothetical protein